MAKNSFVAEVTFNSVAGKINYNIGERFTGNIIVKSKNL